MTDIFAAWDAREAAKKRQPDWDDLPVSVPADHPGGEPRNGATADTSLYAQTALDNEVRNVTAAAEGTRNHTLNVAAYSLGGLIAADQLRIGDVEAALRTAATQAGLEPMEISRTIRSGIDAGMAQPRQIPDWPTTPPVTNWRFGTRPRQPSVNGSIPPVLPEHLWTARPTLEHIRQAARHRLISPDGLLGATLARTSLLTHYGTHLPAMPRQGSLNVIIALVGGSGAGKGSCIDASMDLLPTPDGTCECGDPDHTPDHWVIPAGSGEGIVRAYYEPRTETVNNKKETTLKIDRRHILIRVDEGETLSLLAKRQGQTTMQILRQAWSGEELGFSYANREKNLRIGAHHYRQSVILGIQPILAAPLFSDAAGGTPQRFLWLTLNDPEAPETPPEWPGALPWPQFNTVEHAMGIADSITSELRLQRRDVLLGTAQIDPLDSHRNLNRLKVAALLTVLDQRRSVDVEDWALAGVVLDTSDQVRDWTRARIQEDIAAGVEAGAKRAAHRQVVIDDTVHSSSTTRAAARIKTLLADKPMTDGQLRKGLASRDRGAYDDAMDALRTSGIIQSRQGPDQRGSDKLFWQLTEAEG